MTVGELRNRMTSDELTSWSAYDRENAKTDSDAWVIGAMICATIVNSAPFRAKGSRPAKVEDFLPRKPGPRKTAQQLSIEAANKIMGWGKAVAGKVFSGGKG
jgi:hypothetical protein